MGIPLDPDDLPVLAFGATARSAARIARLWAGACLLVAATGPLLRGDAPGWILAAGIGASYLVFLLGPSILLSPCWASERERGTLEGWALAPRSVRDLWRLQIAARVRPWQPPAVLGLFALGIGVMLLERVDDEVLLSMAVALAWFATAAWFGEGWAAWVATVYRGTVACVAVGILGALGVEMILGFGVMGAEVAILFSRGGSHFESFLAGFVPPIAVHVPLGFYYRRFALVRLERMMGALGS